MKLNDGYDKNYAFIAYCNKSQLLTHSGYHTIKMVP